MCQFVCFMWHVASFYLNITNIAFVELHAIFFFYYLLCYLLSALFYYFNFFIFLWCNILSSLLSSHLFFFYFAFLAHFAIFHFYKNRLLLVFFTLFIYLVFSCQRTLSFRVVSILRCFQLECNILYY